MSLKLLNMIGLNNTLLFIVCDIVTFIIFSLIYFLIYGITAKEYYRIVRMPM